RVRDAYRNAGPDAVSGFRTVLEAMMEPDLRRKYHAIGEQDP
ncbi:MAG: MarR family transcriptional regulator, partial [Pseudomonadota bacterium]